MADGHIPVADLFRQTFAAPGEAAQRILRLDLPRAVWWQLLIVAVLLSVIQTYVSALLAPSDVVPVMNVEPAPMRTAGLVGFGTLAMIMAIALVGRLFGGVGTVEGALRVIAWLQLVLLVPGMVQILALIVAPSFTFIIGWATIALTLWLLSHFVASLHGFESVLKVFFGLIVFGVLLSLAFVTLLGMFGLVAIPELPADV